MNGERIRHDVSLAVIAHHAGRRPPAVAVEGRLLAFEDGRWSLFLAGAEAARGDSGRERAGGDDGAAGGVGAESAAGGHRR